MDTPRRVPGARRLSVPVFHSVPRPSSLRTRSAITRRRRQPIPLPLSRAALQSLAPLNLDIPISSVIVPAHGAAEPQDQREETSLYLVVLNHLVDLEARLHTSSSAMELLHKLRDEVAAFFPSVEGSTQGASSSKPTDEYDFEYDFNLRAALDFPFDFPAFDLNLASELDLNLRARYAELSNLTLDEAKNKLVQLSTLSYDDAISRLGFSALGSRFEDAKNRIKQWADDTVPALPTLPNMPTMPALPIPDLPDLPLPDLHARLAELCAALPADVSSATNRLVSFMEGLIEDDADGDISWVDARWKGLSLGEGREKGKGKGKEGEVDTHKVALALSEGGRKLIRYCDLPEKWKNNEFVMKGYRFIPGYKWPSLVLSIFQMHNETVNIQTHLLPLLAVICALPLPWTELTQSWGAGNLFPTFSTPLVPALSVPSFAAPSLPIYFSLPQLPFTPFPPSPVDPLPKFMFLLAAAACLTCSTIWHTLAGCSDLWWLEAGARVDYVGIGWLISASVSGVMYYGFACQPGWMWAYISVTVVTGLAGSILPFQGWFNERRNKKWRIAFFLLCACSAMVPLAHLAWRHSPGVMWGFIRPLVPSLVSYLTGLAFYATHFPECCFPGRFDWGGSHAVWHVFIVVAIREHWKATAVFHETSHAFSCAAA